jgi:hypothetical protein
MTHFLYYFTLVVVILALYLVNYFFKPQNKKRKLFLKV